MELRAGELCAQSVGTQKEFCDVYEQFFALSDKINEWDFKVINK